MYQWPPQYHYRNIPSNSWKHTSVYHPCVWAAVHLPKNNYSQSLISLLFFWLHRHLFKPPKLYTELFSGQCIFSQTVLCFSQSSCWENPLSSRMLKDSLPNGLMVWRSGNSPKNKPWGSTPDVTSMDPWRGDYCFWGSCFLCLADLPQMWAVPLEHCTLEQREEGSWALYMASRRLGSEHKAPLTQAPA